MIYVEHPSITLHRNVVKLMDEYRRQTGYGARRLAERSGLTRRALQDFRTGRRTPNYDSLQKLASAMEIPVEMFFRR